jgi:propanediol dehydratase small subunit
MTPEESLRHEATAFRLADKIARNLGFDNLAAALARLAEIAAGES